MGTFVGHAGPGLYFLFAGLWFFWRSLDTKWAWNIRRNAKWLAVEPALRIPGGLVVVFAEIYYISVIGYWHTHVEHMWMSLVFSFGGLIHLLHLFRIITGTHWAFFDGLTWGIVGYLFYDHGISENRYLTKGHALFAYLCWMAMFLMWIEVLVARYMNKPHWQQAARRIDSEEMSSRGQSIWGKLISVYTSCCCCCKSGEIDGSINPIYSNPVVYTTPLSALYGFLLFWAGTWQIDLGAQFLNDTNFSPAMTHIHVGHSHDAADPEDSGAMMNYLSHFMVNGLLFALISIIAYRIDKSSGRRALNQSDEFSFPDDEAPMPVASNGSYNEVAPTDE